MPNKRLERNRVSANPPLAPNTVPTTARTKPSRKFSLNRWEVRTRFARRFHREIHRPQVMKTYRWSGTHLQPWLINFGACVFLQAVMRNMPHDADDLAPRLVVAFETQPPPKRGVYV